MEFTRIRQYIQIELLSFIYIDEVLSWEGQMSVPCQFFPLKIHRWTGIMGEFIGNMATPPGSLGGTKAPKHHPRDSERKTI